MRKCVLSRAFMGAAACLICLPVVANAQLRVANWNISNYDDTTTGAGTRTAALRTAIYGIFNNGTTRYQSMSPDVIVGEEFGNSSLSHTQSVADNFVAVLNGATNSPGDWTAATVKVGPDTQTVLFYRTSKISGVVNNTIAQGGADPDQPRDTQRFDLSLAGYSGTAPVISVYGVHLKAGSAGSDNARRLVETTAIRDNAETLPAGRPFLIAGDMNVQNSSQTAYQQLIGSQTNNTGRFFDPIKTPGSWNENSAFKFVHTQDPSHDPGVDDRHDQILLSSNLIDGKGFDYVGNANVAYSTTTWNDPNHSYHAWGNDGTSFEQQLTTTGNTMVGATIAQALKDASTVNGGHLPVFLDMLVPNELAASDSSVDFGTVQLNSSQQHSFNVFNDVDLAKWISASAVAQLDYTMTATGAFSVPSGIFSDLAGGGVNIHSLILNTSTLGLKTGTLSLIVDGVVVDSIPLSANVVPEPGAIALLAGAAIMLFRRRGR